MAIASVGTLGTGANSTSNSSYTFNTATNSLAAGDFGILVSVSDNTATVDGDSNEHTSVSGGTGTWTQLGEYTNAGTGAAAGVTTSVWLFQATGTVNTATTITLSFASNRTDKTCSFWKFTKASGYNITLDTAPATNPITSEVNGAVGFGSSAFSGLASAARLYFRGLGKEANSTTALTVSSGFTIITAQRSRNNAAAVLVRGEFRINTSTGETSNPTMAVSGDTAGLFLSLVESLAPRTGTLAGTESGADTAAVAGDVIVKGSLAGTETGSDTAALAGDVIVQGSAAGTETGDDTAALSGTVSSGVAGDLAATETGDDTAALTGDVLVQGALDATEGADTADITGAVLIDGAAAATEAGDDTAVLAGAVLVQGTLAAAELGDDTAEIAGDVLVQGDFAGTDTADTAALQGTVLVQGALAAAEEGNDTAALTGTVASTPITGTMSAVESGVDELGGYADPYYVEQGYVDPGVSGHVLVQGDLAGVETGADTASIVGPQPVRPAGVIGGGGKGRRWREIADRLPKRQAPMPPILQLAQAPRQPDADHEAQVRAYWDAIDEIRATEQAAAAAPVVAPAPAELVSAVIAEAPPIAALLEIPAPTAARPHPDNAALEALLIAELA